MDLTSLQTNQASMKPHLGIDIRTAESYPGGVEQVKEDIGYSRYWGGKAALTRAFTSEPDQDSLQRSLSTRTAPRHGSHPSQLAMPRMTQQAA